MTTKTKADLTVRPYNSSHYPNPKSWSALGWCGQGGRNCPNSPTWTLEWSKTTSACDVHLGTALRTALSYGQTIVIENNP